MTTAQRSASVIALCLLTACATRLDNAPVVDRTSALGTTGAQPPVPLGPPPPGYYRVKPGDTLYRIALENGQNYRDIATWNNLANPNQIEVDQLLRVVPPGASNAAAYTPGVVTAPVPGMAPQGAQPGGPAAMPPMIGSAAGATSAPSASVPPQASGSDMSAAPAGSISLAWPVRGPLLNGFDDTRNKGVNIGGAPGDAVKAAGDGRVVYAGNGLRGYGNLIIIKHDATFLTAYAHNRALMVKEGDAVTKGQKIAEMGNTDSDRVMLHFEVRRQGKPVDPLKYLPPQ
ncbi:lipoprotein NlpD [Paraburkholderia sp. WP4_3_2]|nr:lipoprotein NlpD [Paraburkholderia sp. WP4_3_2]